MLCTVIPEEFPAMVVTLGCDVPDTLRKTMEVSPFPPLPPEPPTAVDTNGAALFASE